MTQAMDSSRGRASRAVHMTAKDLAGLATLTLNVLGLLWGAATTAERLQRTVEEQGRTSTQIATQMQAVAEQLKQLDARLTRIEQDATARRAR